MVRLLLAEIKYSNFSAKNTLYKSPSSFSGHKKRKALANRATILTSYYSLGSLKSCLHSIEIKRFYFDKTDKTQSNGTTLLLFFGFVRYYLAEIKSV